MKRVSLAAALILLLPTGAQAHGTFHEMMDEMQAELAARPNDPALMIRRAFLEVEHGEWQAAMVDLEKALRFGADEGDLMFLRGRALSVGKQWAAAKLAMDEFFTTHPATAAAHKERGRVCWQLGEQREAVEDYRAALKLAEHPEPELLCEAADVMKAQQLDDEAIQVLDNGIKRLGNAPQLVLKAMDFEIAAQRFDAALLRVDAMQKIMPRAEPWMAKRASVLAQAGRYTASHEEWTKLRAHLLALPNLERGSHAMTTLLAQCDDALAALNQVSSPAKPTPATAASKP